MASTTLDGVLLKGVAASRPAANAVAKGTIYSATDTGAITQSDGSSWSAYATIPGSSSSPQFSTIELGNASDTTLSRSSAGVVAVEGTALVKAGSITSSGLTQATGKLLGRNTASTGAVEEITLGTNLSFSGTTLNAASGGSSVVANGTRQLTGAEYTTTSTSFGDIDATNLSVSLTTGAHRLLVILTGLMDASSGAAVVYDVMIDGTSDTGAAGVFQFRPSAAGYISQTLTYLTQAVSAASHTVKMRWKTDTGTAKLHRSAFALSYTVLEMPF